MKRRVTLESSAIVLVVYDELERSLEVHFRGSGSYRYFEVSLSTFEALLAAESAGTFWNSVKDKYAYERLG